MLVGLIKKNEKDIFFKLIKQPTGQKFFDCIISIDSEEQTHSRRVVKNGKPYILKNNANLPTWPIFQN